MKTTLKSIVCSISLVLSLNGISYAQGCNCPKIFNAFYETHMQLRVLNGMKNYCLEDLQRNPNNPFTERELKIISEMRDGKIEERKDLLRRYINCKCLDE